MPHFILEYSDNLGHSAQSIEQFQQKAHQIATDSNLFPLKGIRSKAYCCSQHRVADGNPNHGIVHLAIKIGTGRTDDEKALFTKLIFNHLVEHFQSDTQGIAISIELKELETVHKYNHNNIADFL